MHAYTYIHTCMHTHVRLFPMQSPPWKMFQLTYTCKCMYTYTQKSICTYIYIYIYIYTYIHTYIHIQTLRFSYRLENAHVRHSTLFFFCVFQTFSVCVCVCMYVCTYMCVYTYIYIYIHTIYIYIYIYTHTHTYTHTYIHTYIHTYTHTYIHPYMHSIHTCMYTCMIQMIDTACMIFTYVCMCDSMICVYLCMSRSRSRSRSLSPSRSRSPSPSRSRSRSWLRSCSWWIYLDSLRRYTTSNFGNSHSTSTITVMHTGQNIVLD